MQKNEQIDVIIYRVRESGLEVFMVDPRSTDGGSLGDAQPLTSLHQSEMAATQQLDNCIELDSVFSANGEERKAIAIEADWHEIPSLRALVYEDYRVAKEKAKQHINHFVTDMEKGTYVAMKEAVKRVMPEQYAFLKELKEIVLDKNQSKSI